MGRLGDDMELICAIILPNFKLDHICPIPFDSIRATFNKKQFEKFFARPSTLNCVQSLFCPGP